VEKGVMADRSQLVELRTWLVANLDRSRLRLLCADLGVEFDDLGGESRASKALELIGYLNRRGRLGDLAQAIERIEADPTLYQVVRAPPTRCPYCNAPLRPDEIRWYNDTQAQCAFCGCTVETRQS
jgi:hypothetical protein